MKEKILSPEEAQALVMKLQIKYGSEAETVQKSIEHDIKKYGKLSHQTKIARRDLRKKILGERNEN